MPNHVNSCGRWVCEHTTAAIAKKMSATGMDGDDGDDGNTKIVRRGKASAWEDVPDDILFIIMRRLTNPVDLFSAGLQCNSWWGASRYVEREVMASLPPLLYTKETNSFYNFKEKKTYYLKNCNPTLLDNKFKCIGFSHGYLILCEEECNELNQTKVFLVNPFTGDEVNNFPLCATTVFNWATLSCPPSSPHCQLVGFGGPTVTHCKPNGKEWRTHSCEDKTTSFCTAAVTKKVVFAVDDKRRFLSFELEPDDGITWLVFNFLPQVVRFSVKIRHEHLVKCDGDILLVVSDEDVEEEVRFIVYRLKLKNFLNMRWERVYDLRGRSLFVNRHAKSGTSQLSSGISSTTAVEWGGGDGKDCIFYEVDASDRVLKTSKMGIFNVRTGEVEIAQDLPSTSSRWVLPSLC